MIWITTAGASVGIPNITIFKNYVGGIKYSKPEKTSSLSFFFLRDES